MMKAEDALNKGLGRILNEITELKTRDILALCWAMLTQEDPNITFDELLTIVDEKDINISYIVTKIGEATNGAGWLVDSKKAKAPKAESSTGM